MPVWVLKMSAFSSDYSMDDAVKRLRNDHAVHGKVDNLLDL